VLLRDLSEFSDSKLRVGSGRLFHAFTVEGRKYSEFRYIHNPVLRHSTLRQQLFFSLLDIPETIALNLLIFGSVNLNDEENKAVFKSVQPYLFPMKNLQIGQKLYMHADLNFTLVRIIYTLREKKMYVSM
jgi:hypothetical protein